MYIYGNDIANKWIVDVIYEFGSEECVVVDALGFGDGFGWVGTLFGLFEILCELFKAFLNVVWMVPD